MNEINIPLPDTKSTSIVDINNVVFDKHETLKILYLNARSINNKNEEIYSIIKNTKHEIHIISITETWMKPENVNFFNFDGYSTLFSCRPTKTGGGAAIFIKNCINYEIIHNYSDNLNSYICAKIIFKNQNWLITNIYRAPYNNTENISTFFTEFNNILEKLQSTRSIITGDFNINILNNNSMTHEYKTIITTNAMYLCDTNTITRDTCKTAIDHVITNTLDKTINIQYAPYDLLDHKLMFIEIKDTEIETVTNYNRMISSICQPIVYTHLTNSPIQINTASSVNNMYNTFTSKLKTIIIKATTTKKQKSFPSNKPWYDNELHKQINIKNFWYVKKIKDPTNINVIAEYKIARNKTTAMIREKKRKYFKNGFVKSIGDNKKTWQHINTVLYNGNKAIKNNPISTNIDQKSFIEGLNQYTSQVGKSLHSSNIQTSIYYIGMQTNARFSFTLTNKTDIENTIKSLKNTKSCGHDDIDTETLKYNSQHISEIIKTIINSSMITGEVPDQIKLTKITPIHKTGSTTNFTNYRPISLIPIIAKIFEKIINKQLLIYLESNNIIHKKQYGFRYKSGTSTALFDFTTEIQTALDKKYKVATIFFDLKKAFETVSRKILMKKLNSIGIQGVEYIWFKNYLSNRLQYTELNEIRSSTKNIDTGVPQGANLASTLFIIFINDIMKLELEGKIFVYADDMAIVYHSESEQNLQQQMNLDCQKISDWMDKNELIVNETKTKFMVFNKNNITPHIQINYKSNLIEETNEMKYLGIHIDSTLSWKTHIQKTVSKVAGITGIFRKVSTHIPNEYKRQIFYALFHSRVTYGILTWYSAFKTHKVKLQTIQNKAIRNLYKHSITDSNIEIHKINNILNLDQHFKYIVATHIHNIINENIHTTSIIQSNAEIHQHDTRSSTHLNVCKSNTIKYGQNQAIRQGIKIYNQLPPELKSENTKKFKKKLKQIIQT